MQSWKRLVVALSAAAILTSGIVAAPPPETAYAQEDMAVACAEELKLTTPVAEDKGKKPVFLVHGRGGKPKAWLEGEPSMADVLAEIDEAVIVEPFDYESESNKWVANSDAAHRLAKTIVCYYLLYGEEVVVVAHSMGGLLTYEASDWAAYGIFVRDALGHIASIGSPFEGSWLASTGFAFVIAFCEMLVAPTSLMADTDELCREAHSDWSISGLSYNSDQLAELPDLPDGITHKAIAGRIQMEVCFFGCAQFSIGDGVVPSESATARYTDTGVGDGPKIFDCTVSEGAWCSHSGMLQDERVQYEVKASIETYIGSQQVEMTNLHGLQLPLTADWELSDMTLNRASHNRPLSTVVKTSLCNPEGGTNDYCAGFTVVDTTAYTEWSSASYPQGEKCPWYSLRDGLWHTLPQTTEEMTIGGRPAAHRTHWQCESDGNGNATPPQSAEVTQDVMHSWEVDGLVIVEHYPNSDDPLPGIENLLVGASWS